MIRSSILKTLYMDYESNAAILIANYIFCKPKELAILKSSLVFTASHRSDFVLIESAQGKAGLIRLCV